MKINDFIKAKELISPWIIRTPLIVNEALNSALGKKIYLKCENFQITGSSKIRGCMNSMLSGDKTPRITRSSGNFAQAIAWAGKNLDIPVTVVMPETAPLIKIERTRAFGAEVIVHGTTHAAGELKVLEIMQQSKKRYTSPFSDHEVILGQGSLALEIYDEQPVFKHYLCPVGGGGLMAGTAAVLKQLDPSIEVVAVEPVGGNDFFLSLQANERTSIPGANTIADGLRAPCVGELNWPILQRYVDRAILTKDDDIIAAMKLLRDLLGIVVEPSGAASLAAALAHIDTFDKGDIVCVISGGNVDLDKYEQWMRYANDSLATVST